MLAINNNYTTPTLLQIKTLFRKDNTTTAKLHMIADLKSLEDIPGYDGSSTAPNTRGSNSNIMVSQPMCYVIVCYIMLC